MAGHPDELIETNLGEALTAAGQPDDALRHYELALQLDPRCYLALYDIGTYLLQHGRAAESLTRFQAAIQYSASPHITQYAQGNLGEAYLALGENAQAERAFTEALRYDPFSVVALLGRGQALLRLQQYPEAESDFVQALRLQPQPELFYLLGMALEGEQRYGLALQSYSQALQRDPGMAPAQTRIAVLQQRNAPAALPAR
jgi:tetratricopeptide (TPR) repeat protein